MTTTADMTLVEARELIARVWTRRRPTWSTSPSTSPPRTPSTARRSVAYFGSGRFGVEISREEAIRVTVRELAERVQPGLIINDCGFTEAERRQMHHSP